MKSVEFLQWAATVLLMASVLVSLIAAIRETSKDRLIGRLRQGIVSPSSKKSSPRGRKPPRR